VKRGRLWRVVVVLGLGWVLWREIIGIEIVVGAVFLHGSSTGGVELTEGMLIRHRSRPREKAKAKGRERERTKEEKKKRKKKKKEEVKLKPAKVVVEIKYKIYKSIRLILGLGCIISLSRFEAPRGCASCRSRQWNKRGAIPYTNWHTTREPFLSSSAHSAFHFDPSTPAFHRERHSV